jgi:hypothetical protein
LYFHHCKPIKYNKQVTTENATRLFELSEQLCGKFVSTSSESRPNPSDQHRQADPTSEKLEAFV